MKIILKGKPVTFVGRQVICYKCKSVIEIEQDNEVMDATLPISGYNKYINCPVCDASVILKQEP